MTLHTLVQRLGPTILDAVESTQKDREFGEAVYLGNLRGRYVMLVLDEDGTAGVLCAERGSRAPVAWDIPHALSVDLTKHAQRIERWLTETSDPKGLTRATLAQTEELLASLPSSDLLTRKSLESMCDELREELGEDEELNVRRGAP